MKYNSLEVRSNQLKRNTKLRFLLEKNSENNFKPFINDSTVNVHNQIKYFSKKNIPLILDCGCGTGKSSLSLAQNNQNAIVFGLDRADRFINSIFPSNLICARVELTQLWKLLWEERTRISKTYLLYPNPWPKSKHLKRRWYAHPAFKYLVKISEYLEIRTNWEIYALEAYFSLKMTTTNKTTLKHFIPNLPISLHEKKYFFSGHDLFKVTSSKKRSNSYLDMRR